MNRVLADLIDLLDLEDIEDNLFRGQSRDLGGKSVFGGQVLGQALVAATRTVGTAVFMIYVTDAAGYAGSIALMLGKHAFGPDTAWQREMEAGFLYDETPDRWTVAGALVIVGAGIYVWHRETRVIPTRAAT